jgi:DNA-binding MarR family transcriptional regulator
VHTRLTRELDRRLRAEHGFGVVEFDVLITLFNAPEEGLRMTDLANAIMLSPAGLTHLVTRLERDRLVERHVDPADRRSARVRLADAGHARLDAARTTHNEVVRGRFTTKVSDRQLRQLAQVWSAVLDQ